MKAIRASRYQRSDLALKYALKHLSSHPDDSSVISILNKSANSYFQDLQKKIQHFEQLNNWEKVVSTANDGYQLLSKVANISGTDFPTKNELDFLESKREQSKFKQADEIYKM